MCCEKIEEHDLKNEDNKEARDFLRPLVFNGVKANTLVKEGNMILSEEEAKQCICRVKQTVVFRPMPMHNPEEMCVGSKCFAYWRWADAEHTKGYCSIAGKPEFE